jgi:hypothetical protein
MAITFLNLQNRIRIREPFLKKIRAIYRGSRSSYDENLEIGLIINDFEKLANELDLLSAIKELKIKTFGTIYFQENEDSISNDGFSEEYEDISLFFGESAQEYNPLVLDSLAKIGSSISRISQKVKRLETGN